MPGLSSVDWMAAVRGGAPTTPLVVYSGRVPLDELWNLAYDWDVAAVLAKPFSPADLVRAVRGALGQQPTGGGNS
jgi:DNA-binding NtrC family response regulator